MGKSEFVALGHAGSDAYAGLETFPNPGVRELELTSDELTAVCPITGQPDFYTATIAFRPDAHCLESKSLKIYLARFRRTRFGHVEQRARLRVAMAKEEEVESQVDRKSVV